MAQPYMSDELYGHNPASDVLLFTLGGALYAIPFLA